MDINYTDSKSYKTCVITENPDIFSGYFQDYELSDEVLKKLSKDLGFSHDLYSTLYTIDEKAALVMVNSMSRQSKKENVVFLVDDEYSTVVDYTLETDRYPILSTEFIKSVDTLSSANPHIKLSDVYYSKDDTLSSVIFKKKSPITITEQYLTSQKYIDYEIGILLVNDEVGSTSSRLVVYIDGQPVYLPPSYYNATSSRYKRSTSSSLESLEVLLLKVIDDLREDYLKDKLLEFHYRYRTNKSILSSYEEYYSVLKCMRKIPTVIDDTGVIDSLVLKDNFKERYPHLDDKKSSYVWRCTALGDFTIGSLVSTTASILNILEAPPSEYFDIRDLLGTYLSTKRNAEDIAREEE